MTFVSTLVLAAIFMPLLLEIDEQLLALTKRLLSVFASHAHLDTQGASSPASGEAAVGFGGAHQPHGHALCGGRGARAGKSSATWTPWRRMQSRSTSLAW